MNTSILNINISCFANCKTTTPKSVNLLGWLTSKKYYSKVNDIRSIQDENLQRVIKKSLPAITPSGVFRYRSMKHLIQHSGFIAIDIDFDDNKHIVNFSELKNQLSHIENVAYCGLSVRGKGLWALIPIPKSTPEIHGQRFDSLLNDFKDFNINIDKSGRDVCRLRIYSHDPNAYFNHSAKLYTKLNAAPKLLKRTYPRSIQSDTRTKVETVISRIKNNKIDITHCYEEWFKLAVALANEFGESGRGYFHAISQFNGKYNFQTTDRMFDGCLKGNYSQITIASFFKIASDYGIKAQSDKSSGKISIGQLESTKNRSDGHDIKQQVMPFILVEESSNCSQEKMELKYLFNKEKPSFILVIIDKTDVLFYIPLFVDHTLALGTGNNWRKKLHKIRASRFQLESIITINMN